jgi:hypothetical protein
VNVPTGSREVYLPGSLLNPDGKQAKPILARLDEAFTDPVPPSLDVPTDETWMRLDPVSVGEAEHQLPIIYSTETLMRDTGRNYPLTHMQVTGYVHTLGPFKSERFVRAVRAHQHRRMSLTLAGQDADGRPVHGRWFDIDLSLDVDLRLLRGPAFWLDWMAHPVGTRRPEYAVIVARTPAVTA